MSDLLEVSELSEEQSHLVLNCMVKRRERTNHLFTWTIHNYRRLRKEVLYGTTGGKSWRFRLVKTKGTLFTALITDKPCSRVFFSVMSNKMELMRVHGSISVDLSVEQNIPISPLYVAEFCRRAVENPEFMQGDELIVQCSYSDAAVDVGQVVIPPFGQDTADLFQLCADFQRLRDATDLCDFDIWCGNQFFKAHKTVLMARCRFFTQTNDHECAVVSDNADLLALEDVLHYLYSGEFQTMDVQHVLDVLHTAQAFECDSLVRKCSVLLQVNLAQDNVMPVLAAAREYNMELLTSVAERFMVRNFGMKVDVDDDCLQDMMTRRVWVC